MLKWTAVGTALRGSGSVTGFARLGTLLLAAGLLPAALPGSGEATRRAAEDPGREAEGPAVTLAELSWLQGTWRGEGPGGGLAEIHYMAPEAGVLPSIFRLWSGEELIVMELLSLVEDEEGLVMYIRHFSEDLTPFERDHPLTIRVVEGSPDRLYFENVRDENPRVSEMVRTGPDAFTSRSELHRPDGSVDTIRVEYTRVREAPEESGGANGRD